MFYCLFNRFGMYVNCMLIIISAPIIETIVNLISKSMSIEGSLASLDTTMVDFTIFFGLFMSIKFTIMKQRLIAVSENRVITQGVGVNIKFLFSLLFILN